MNKNLASSYITSVILVISSIQNYEMKTLIKLDSKTMTTFSSLVLHMQDMDKNYRL